MHVRDIHRHLSGTSNSGLSRRLFFGTAAGAGTMLGAGRPQQVESEHERERAERFRPNPIPWGLGPFAPFGVFIHHLPPLPVCR